MPNYKTILSNLKSSNIEFECVLDEIKELNIDLINSVQNKINEIKISATLYRRIIQCEKQVPNSNIKYLNLYETEYLLETLKLINMIDKFKYFLISKINEIEI